MDFLPTFLAGAGDPDVVAKCLKGDRVGDKVYKVHLDGYNLIPFFKGEVKESPRKGFIYWSDATETCLLSVLAGGRSSFSNSSTRAWMCGG
jgi:arylsulfatase